VLRWRAEQMLDELAMLAASLENQRWCGSVGSQTKKHCLDLIDL
jgi:hypothetical protein